MARDKAERFVELANKRVARVIKDMRLVSNLANRNNYEFTEDQAKKIVRAVQKEAEAVRAAFVGSTAGHDTTFKL